MNEGVDHFPLSGRANNPDCELFMVDGFVKPGYVCSHYVAEGLIRRSILKIRPSFRRGNAPGPENDIFTEKSAFDS